ncbi:MAG: ATP/GTP-binding protein [Xanthomonadales bacterium]|nr:ATP/GTP-binding protein [Xanthomonadales bacterium]
MSFHKIIFTGPVGAGKSTAIKAISDTAVIHTEQQTTDETKEIKSQTTVAMDYGSIIIANNEKIHLYGTPGQKRFSFMWDILSKGGTGLILIIDASEESAIDDMNYYLENFKSLINETAVVVGITKTDLDQKFSLDDFNQEMANQARVFPIFEVDARSPTDIKALVEALLLLLAPALAVA